MSECYHFRAVQLKCHAAITLYRDQAMLALRAEKNQIAKHGPEPTVVNTR